MNGIQRFKALSQKEPLDKIPVRVGNYNIFLTYYYDITIQEYLDDPKANAESFVQMVKDFDFDSIKAGLGYIFYGCGPETGLVWDFPDNNYPACTKGIINDKNDIAKIIIPKKPQGYFEKFLDINRRVKKELGGATHLGISVLGPFSVMAFFRGFEKILLDMITDQELFQDLMDKGADYALFLGKKCLELELPWANLMEIFLVPGVVNPVHYHQLIAPYDDKVSRELASPPLSNYLSMFMGRPDDPQSWKEGKLISDFYFGSCKTVGEIRNVYEHATYGVPCQISISGNDLVHSPTDQIIDFLVDGLDYFFGERHERPFIYLPSIQAESRSQAQTVAEKLKRINNTLRAYKEEIPEK